MKHIIFLISLLLSLPLAAQQSVVYGYCNKQSIKNIGNAGTAPLISAIYVPAVDIAPYIGKKITKIEVALAGPTTNLLPFISTGTKNRINPQPTTGTAGWNTLTLPEPYTIGSQGLYVGYQSQGQLVIGLSNTYNDNGCMILNSSGTWDNYAVGNNWAALAIRFTIEGNDLPTTIKISPIAPIETLCENNHTTQVTVQNLTDRDIHSLSYEFWIDDHCSYSGDYTGTFLQSDITPLSATINTPLQYEGDREGRFFITKINGEAVSSNKYQSTTPVLAVSPSNAYPRKIVFEEGTGTWCPWCVRGIIGMKEAAQLYPDHFIGIALHSGDEMDNHHNYNSLLYERFYTFPSCIVNRLSDIIIDPSTDYFKEMINKYKNSAHARIASTMYAADADTTSITINTETEFAYDTHYEYRIAYAIVENNVGPYLQKNAYAGGSNGAMGGFEKEPSYVSLYFNDVARGIYPSINGQAGSIPFGVKAHTPHANTYTLRLPSNITNKSNIEVIAMIIDQRTGVILNADRCTYSDSTPIDIIDLSHSASQPQSIYSLNGTPQHSLKRGINIIRDSEGKAKKVFRSIR